MFVGTVVMVAIATFWVEGSACLNTCSKGYHYTKHLVIALYIFESAYLLSVVALIFFRRTLGLEKIDNIMMSLHTQAVNKENAKKDRISQINSSDPY